MISASRTSDFRISGSAISSHKNIQGGRLSAIQSLSNTWTRYYSPSTTNFLTKERYNYVKSSPLNYIDPSSHIPDDLALANRQNLQKNVPLANSIDAKRANESMTGQTSSESAKSELDEKQRKAWNYIKDLIQKAQDKSNDFAISCESYVAGVNAVNNSLGSGGVLATAEGVGFPKRVSFELPGT